MDPSKGGSVRSKERITSTLDSYGKMPTARPLSPTPSSRASGKSETQGRTQSPNQNYAPIPKDSPKGQKKPIDRVESSYGPIPKETKKPSNLDSNYGPIRRETSPATPSSSSKETYGVMPTQNSTNVYTQLPDTILGGTASQKPNDSYGPIPMSTKKEESKPPVVDYIPLPTYHHDKRSSRQTYHEPRSSAPAKVFGYKPQASTLGKVRSETDVFAKKDERDYLVSIPREGQTKESDLPNLEGMLAKKGEIGIIKQWRGRYFLLRKDTLVYYKNKEKRDEEDLIGFINLADASAIRPTYPNSGAFQIVTKERVWNLKAEGQEEMTRWINAIKLHSAYVPPGQSGNALTRNDLPDKSGYMEKLSKGMQMGSATWEPRWVVIRQGMLYRYKHMNSGQPRKTPLYRCSIDAYRDPTSQNNSATFRITTDNEKELVFRAQTLDLMNEWITAITMHRTVIENILGYKGGPGKMGPVPQRRSSF
eukprot:TRINITY_DN12641_c0_g1_i2.p1 TRINITY_DN12641_c0_g1~~TRINITY_DN12641_c0_g1_i2.p1  ORF type:complete len:478 (-),score=107.64 TRINITY_DN12641_c0_g1_i2:73-1506(-)